MTIGGGRKRGGLGAFPGICRVSLSLEKYICTFCMVLANMYPNLNDIPFYSYGQCKYIGKYLYRSGK